MQITQLKSEYIHREKNAHVMVIFGGNPQKRNHVINMLEEFGKITAYATLSEEEGIEKLKSLQAVDFILIGGKYSHEQRIRIKEFARVNFPITFISEPGIDYPYSDEGVINDIRNKLKL